MPRLARGIVTFECPRLPEGSLPLNALGLPEGSLPLNALGLPEGSLRSLLHTDTQRPLMPPACPVDTYDLSYRSEERNDPPGKPVAFSSFDAVPCSDERNDPPGKPVAFQAASTQSPVATNVTIHRASRWHSGASTQSPVARNVTIHRASRWHSGSFDAVPCSEERNDPPGKPVAFRQLRSSPL